MPNVTLQNLTNEDVYIGDHYAKIPRPQNNGPNQPNELGVRTFFRTSVELMNAPALHKAIAEGKVTLGITFTPDEISSGFNIFPGFSGGGGTDLTIYDEGVELTTTAESIDFVGAGVTATNVGNAVTVNVGAGNLPTPSAVGQVLFSVDGLAFTVEDPLTSTEGWIVNDDGVLLVQG